MSMQDSVGSFSGLPSHDYAGPAATPWTIERLSHNLDVLYNHLDLENIYVDQNNNLQIDDRSFFQRLIPGSDRDTSKQRICKCAIQILQNTILAVEHKTLDADHIVKETRPPSSDCFKTKNEWVDHVQLGMVIGNKSYYRTTMHAGTFPEDRMTEAQLFYGRIHELAEMLMYGRAVVQRK